MREKMVNAITTRSILQENNEQGSAQRERIANPTVTALRIAIYLAAPSTIIYFRNHMQPWIFMWLLAASIFAICKSQSWFAAGDFARRATWRRNATYLFLWPGMNATQFLDASIVVPRPAAREWASALAKTFSGAALIWLVARHIPHPLLAAWVGMLGLILILHFGIFDLLSLVWRSAGISAQPIMQHPLQSKSLSEFWGKRWNLGFRHLSHDWIFAPVRKHCGIATATLAAFAASGLIHDLVISVPARAGYGFPTAYFLAQGIGVLIERSNLGAKIGLQRGASGWLWMAVFTAAPAYFLFHPWFAMRVMLPFLRAIGAGC
jgi:alginate O-acetyltransferase complex protein AlgI